MQPTIPQATELTRRSPQREIPVRRLYSVNETLQMLGISRATFWRNQDQFDLRRFGRRIFIPAEAIDRFIADLEMVNG